MTCHKNKTDEQTGKSQAWRSELKGAWKGNRPVQCPVKGLPYSTVLQVTNTVNSVLIKEVEPKLAKAS